MSLSAAVIDALVAAGATVDQLAAAMKADCAEREAKEAARLEEKRAGNAERQARFRNRHRAESNEDNALPNVTERDSVTSGPSLDKSPQTPKINPTPHVHGEGAPAHTRGADWACPDGVDPGHWRDFRANRRRKSLATTPTAYAHQLKLIEKFACDEWPPGRLVEKAAEKGWGTIVDPSEYETPRNGNRTANRPEQPANPMLAALQRRRAAEPGPGFPAGNCPAIANTG
jgi:hypothetical protein